jgi:DNA-binding XRE family transcriptional regulator
MASTKGNKKVAQNRGDAWKAKLMKGKLDSGLHPTLIKQKRVEKGFSQVKMASDIEVSLATYGSIERARIGIKKPLATFIAAALGITVDKAFKKDNEKYVAIKVK